MGYNDIMSPAAEITGTQLTDALRALDINFIMGGQSTNETLHKQPARLIAALAKSGESRLRLSLIPLFLEHPEFALHVRIALDQQARQVVGVDFFNVLSFTRSINIVIL